MSSGRKLGDEAASRLAFEGNAGNYCPTNKPD
jgi:hypothetical protein